MDASIEELHQELEPPAQVPSTQDPADPSKYLPPVHGEYLGSLVSNPQ